MLPERKESYFSPISPVGVMFCETCNISLYSESTRLIISWSAAVSEFSTRERWAIVQEKRITIKIRIRHRRMLTIRICKNLTFKEFPDKNFPLLMGSLKELPFKKFSFKKLLNRGSLLFLILWNVCFPSLRCNISPSIPSVYGTDLFFLTILRYACCRIHR